MGLFLKVSVEGIIHNIDHWARQRFYQFDFYQKNLSVKIKICWNHYVIGEIPSIIFSSMKLVKRKQEPPEFLQTGRTSAFSILTIIFMPIQII